MPTAFISYSHRDRDFVQRLAREIMEQFLVAPEETPDISCLDGPRPVFDWGVGQGSEGYRI